MEQAANLTDVPQTNEEKQTSEKAASFNENQEEVDEEGLLTSGYDVIICGTNLIHSILASALALAGKQILHCDGADYYGEVDASMDLKGILEWAEAKAKKSTKPVLNKIERNENNEEDEDDSDYVSLNQDGSWSGLHIHSYSSINRNNDELNKRSIEKKLLTPYGKGSIVEMKKCTYASQNTVTTISLDEWTLADGKSPLLYTCNQFPSDESEKTILDYVEESLSHSRRFILDLTTQGPLLLANNQAVSGLLSSNVADYVEFKSVQSLHIMLPSASSSTKLRSSIGFKSSSSTLSSSSSISSQNDRTKIGEDKSKSLSLHRVPCSKGDVFQTSLLSPLEKRKLMKFLQLISDYGISDQEQKLLEEHQQQQQQQQKQAGNEEKSIEKEMGRHMENLAIQSLNERKLNQGRSLKRPQNKTVSTTSLQELKSIMNSENTDSNQPYYFHTYLQETLKLSPRLTYLILYSLAMQTISTNEDKRENKHPCEQATVQEGITALVQHLHSLGRFGKTAFLMPLYGCGELSQSFCRSAAVHGGTYLLRRCPTKIEVSKKKTSLGVRLMGDPDFDMEQREKVVNTKHVVVPTAALFNHFSNNDNTTSVSTSRIIKRISVVHGIFPNLQSANPSSPIQEEDDGKSMIVIIPPETPHIENVHAVQGVVLDHSANVSALTYSVVYLCTTIEDNQECKSKGESILERAMSSLLAKANTNIEEGETKLEEVHHVCFSVMNDLNPITEKNTIDKIASPNIHASKLPSQSLTVESAFIEAKRIFHSICDSNQENENQEALKFLEICSALLKIREEQRNGGYGDLDEDDEKATLESALSMIDLEKDKKENSNVDATKAGDLQQNSDTKNELDELKDFDPK